MLRNNADARRCSYFEVGLPVVFLNFFFKKWGGPEPLPPQAPPPSPFPCAGPVHLYGDSRWPLQGKYSYILR